MEVLKNSDLHINQLKIEKNVKLTDPTKPAGQQERDGQFFVSLPTELAKALPGSVVDHNQFIENLEGEKNSAEAGKLISEKIGTSENITYSFYDHKNFALNIYHGSSNANAIEITRVAKQLFNIGLEINKKKDSGEDTTNLETTQREFRAEYQKNVVKVMRSIMIYGQPNNQTHDRINNKPYDLYIVETIMGILVALSKLNKSFLSDRITRKIRIDLAVATTQGVLILREFAKQNNLNIELNVGYMAYGLSEGAPIEGTEARAHANYLEYPPTVLESMPENARNKLKVIRGEDGQLYVVGDMGDNFNSLRKKYDKDYPWNQYRDDDHGEREHDEVHRKEEKINDNAPLILYFANGGHFMDALVDYFGIGKKLNKLTIRASRVWAKEEKYGFGVLINDIPEKYLQANI